MICCYYQKGQKLNVADLNQITVLIDRSETKITEVGWNLWPAGIVGPPHLHAEKEQLFYITSGTGTVTVENESFQVKNGSMVYIPARATHQTVADHREPLTYLLFNFFLTSDKEGHASFAEHIEKVKETRKRQAEQGQVFLEDQANLPVPNRQAKFIKEIPFGNKSTASRCLIDRNETERFEVQLIVWQECKHIKDMQTEIEQTFFILSGDGLVNVEEETREIGTGHVIFVPINQSYGFTAGLNGLSALCVKAYAV